MKDCRQNIPDHLAVDIILFWALEAAYNLTPTPPGGHITIMAPAGPVRVYRAPRPVYGPEHWVIEEALGW